MLPGTGGVPRVYRLIVRTGAAQGYHSVGLTYPNPVSVADLCSGTTDPDCSGNVRREIITGENLSPLVAINSANSITGRLTTLLSHLHSSFPSEGWGQYLRNGSIDWSLVSIAGHSQGSGHAAYVGKMHSVARITMFSGPSDVPVGGEAAARWLTLPNVTPASRIFGFTHRDDTLIPFALMLNNWGAIGLGSFGAATTVDGASAPFGGSHQLFSTAAPNPNPIGINASSTHGAPVVDNVTPLTAAGRPAYEPVWIALALP